MTWQEAWLTAGVPEIPLDVARATTYVGVAGREGVVGPTDLLVAPTGSPSAAITVAPGVFVTTSRFAGAAYESYVGRNIGGSVTTAVSNTGGTSRSDLVYAHITDPGQAGQPATPAPVETRVITGVSSGVTRLQDVPGYETQTGYALARITRPANTTSVQSSHITDLRGYIEDATSPAAQLAMYAGNTAPTGWLFCTGQNVSRTTFARLFALIGTTYGAGDGSTTFTLPDFRGRAPIGTGLGDASGATNHTLGQKAGAETHALTVAELAPHFHLGGISDTTAFGTMGSGSYSLPSGSGTGGLPTSTAGSGAAHNNMQPYIAVNFIIKAY